MFGLKTSLNEFNWLQYLREASPPNPASSIGTLNFEVGAFLESIMALLVPITENSNKEVAAANLIPSILSSGLAY